MEGQVAVSIICNAYNHGKYIRDALEGFVIQKTNFPFEVLVHDDASTDNTADVIREYEAKYPEIIKPIYQTENQYQKNRAAVRKIQSARVQGKYIALCEGDDYWTDPLKLQKQYDYMESHPESTLCACSTDWLNMLNGKVENRCRVAEDTDFTLEDIILEKKGRIFPTVSVFVKSEIWLEKRTWGFPIGDYPLAIYAALYGNVHMLADSMCVYRWYAEGSWTARMDDADHRAVVSEKMIKGLENLDEFTEHKYTDIISRRLVRHKYNLALMKGDWEAIHSEELKGWFKSRSLGHRLSVFVRCKCPKLYPLIKNLTKNRSRNIKA